MTTATTTTKPAARFLPWVDMLAEVGSCLTEREMQLRLVPGRQRVDLLQ